MELISTSWTCLRCGDAYLGPPPEHGLCDRCVAELDTLIKLAPLASQPCPVCGGPVCTDCGQRLVPVILITRPEEDGDDHH